MSLNTRRPRTPKGWTLDGSQPSPGRPKRALARRETRRAFVLSMPAQAGMEPLPRGATPQASWGRQSVQSTFLNDRVDGSPFSSTSFCSERCDCGLNDTGDDSTVVS